MRWLDAALAVTWFTVAGEAVSQVPADTVPADTTPAIVIAPDTAASSRPQQDTLQPDTARVPDARGTNGTATEQQLADACPLGPHKTTARAVAGATFVGANLEDQHHQRDDNAQGTQQER